MTRTEEAVQAISLYHELLSESDKDVLWEIANRGLRKAVQAGKARIISIKEDEQHDAISEPTA